MGVKKVKKKSAGLDERQSRFGYFFVAHWVFGLLVFFAVPLISSIIYSFSELTLVSGGMKKVFVGFSNFKQILQEDPNYVNNLRNSVTSIFYSLPIIISLSLILAVVLNQKFIGRTVARAIFFMPVIIASGVVIVHLSGPIINAPLFTVSSGEQSTYGGLIDFKAILGNLNLPSQLSDILSKLLGNIFGLIWDCGVQIILFLAGLQSINPSLYEVSKIEGANKWEEFWFITIPMLRYILTLVIIYTMIELFTAIDSPVMEQAYTIMQEKQIYDRSSAMLWLYFVVVGAVIGIILFAYNKLCLKKWD